MTFKMQNTLHGTTVVSVRCGGKVVIGADGQVTLGNSIILKGNAQKVRKLLDREIIVGFAGATADAFTLTERLEDKIEEFGGKLDRAAVALAKEWRSDRVLRRLQAMIIAVDSQISLMITGNGDVIQPEDNVMGIGSGGPFAQSAAIALIRNTNLSAYEIAEKSLEIAANICIFTNHSRVLLEIDSTT